MKKVITIFLVSIGLMIIQNVKCLAMKQTNNKYGNTPLHIAAEEGDLKSVKALVEAGAHINALNYNLQKPKHLAEKSCWLAIPQDYYKAFAVWTYLINNEYLLTYFKHYNTHDNTKLEELLQNGAFVDIRNKHGYTLLMLAAIKGNQEMVQLLLRYGADVNAQTPCMMDTALHLAVLAHQKHIIPILLQAGADKLKQNRLGKRAIDLAHKEILELLNQTEEKLDARAAQVINF